MTEEIPSLAAVRAQIDELDVKIQEFITQRAQLATAVARAKYAQEADPIFYRPEREAEVLQKVKARNQGPLSDETLTRIFRDIMSECLALQKPLKVAFLGPSGTYSQAAVEKHFGHRTQLISLQTIDEVFREVQAGTANYGVVPVENSTEGGVNQTLDCFITTALKIVGEIELAIHHNLLSKTMTLETISTIYAHQQSFAQCRAWLDNQLPTVKRIAVNSNAEAARLAASDSKAAAIASQSAAEIYQLSIVASRIEDDLDNTTRFAVIGIQEVPATGKDKTSLLLSAPNQVGSLYQLLAPFVENGVNMTRIESRPSRKGVWDYVFFLDIEGHIQEMAVAKAITALKQCTSLVKHLGSYPKAVC